MRVVVDEGVPRQLAAALQRAGLDAHRFKSIWKGFTNGRLIAAVSGTLADGSLDEAGYAAFLRANTP